VNAIGDLLSAFDSLTQTLAGLVTDSPWTYLLVFALVALDVLFPVLPAEASVLIAAVLAGAGQLSIGWIVIAATLGAFVGDNVAYWIGRTAGRPLVTRVLRGHAERLDQVGREFHDRGASFIIIGRFIPGGRTAVAVGAGVLHYPWLRFIAYDALAAVIWALQAAIPGYIGGVVFTDRPWIGLAVGIAIAVAITVTIEAVRRIRDRQRTSGSVEAGGSAGGGLGLASGPDPDEALDRPDRDPGSDRGPEQAVVAEPQDGAGSEQRVPEPRPDDREPEGDGRLPADASDDDEVGTGLEGAHQDR
jgi:membrane protein DedA with SNARE-associated domain